MQFCHCTLPLEGVSPLEHLLPLEVMSPLYPLKWCHPFTPWSTLPLVVLPQICTPDSPKACNKVFLVRLFEFCSISCLVSTYFTTTQCFSLVLWTLLSFLPTSSVKSLSAVISTIQIFSVSVIELITNFVHLY